MGSRCRSNLARDPSGEALVVVLSELTVFHGVHYGADVAEPAGEQVQNAPPHLSHREAVQSCDEDETEKREDENQPRTATTLRILPRELVLLSLAHRRHFVADDFGFHFSDRP